jgi:hypothetical protein
MNCRNIGESRPRPLSSFSGPQMLVHLDTPGAGLRAVYTYDSASDYLSDLHANRLPIRFSLRFRVRQQSTPILEIDTKRFLGGKQYIFGKHIRTATRQQEIGQRTGCKIGNRFSCRTENRISIRFA